VSRRLLDICLLAYPGARRRRDRDYLRDLALELAERQGLARQVVSLLIGGLRERAAGAGEPAVRLGVATVVVVALVLGANTLVGGERERELERFSCVAQGGGERDCADATSMVAARERAGWECRTRGGRRSITWECSRAS
jgi:hypothetical protein